MPMRLSASQLAGKVEGTEGNKETLAANDCVLHRSPSFAPVVEQFDRDLMRGSLSRSPTISGKRSAVMNFECEMVGQGNKGVAPYWGKFLQGCGFNETISANNSVTYTPLTNNMTNSMTLAMYHDGVIKRMWGARGTVVLVAEAGKPGLLRFTFEGCDFEVVDGALLSPTYPTLIPPVFLNAALLYDSYAAVLGKVEVDIGNILSKRESMNSTSGFLSTFITGRNPRGTMDPELTTVAAFNWYGKWMTPGTIGQLSFAANGGNGNIITITCPKARLMNITDQDRTGLRTMGVEFQPTVNSADDELSIVLT